MSISEKLEKMYKYQLKNIKNEKNRIVKKKMIGNLMLDVGGRCISAIAKTLGCSRKYVKKCYDFVKEGCIEQTKFEFRGRKRITVIYPNLENDITKIIENSLSIDPKFKTEKQYVNMTVKKNKK